MIFKIHVLKFGGIKLNNLKTTILQNGKKVLEDYRDLFIFIILVQS